MERIEDMPALFLFVFRFVHLLFSGHQAIAIENAALRMQIAAFQRKRADSGACESFRSDVNVEDSFGSLAGEKAEYEIMWIARALFERIY